MTEHIPTASFRRFMMLNMISQTESERHIYHTLRNIVPKTENTRHISFLGQFSEVECFYFSVVFLA